MKTEYPPIEPYDHGLLDAGDGILVYWEACVTPSGKPVLVLHGGPGSGCTPWHRRIFDPAAYRIVLFDQGLQAEHATRQRCADRPDPQYHPQPGR